MSLRKSLLGATASLAFASMAMADAHEGERGRDGQLNILYWQAITILNPYLSGGTKDLQAASMILEPLANYDEGGTLVPTLAMDIPTVANGGVSADLTTTDRASAPR